MRCTTMVGACLAVCLMTACGNADTSADALAGGDSMAGTASSDSSSRRTTDSSTDSSTSSVRDSAAPTDARALLTLDGEGLRFVNSQTGATRALSYGTPAQQAISAVATVLGDATDRGTNRECGAGPVDFVTFPGGLQLVVQDDRFVGWTARPNGDQPLRTMSNIGLGSTRAELESVYLATIARSTIGVEFMAGGLQGVLESDAPTARITDLWSGVSCVFR